MKYVNFHIENYKAIESVDLTVSRNVIPLIGINESGKTTILQAILAFDKSKDHLLDGVHLESKNKYKTSSKSMPTIITASVVVSSSDEADEIINKSSLNTSGELYSWCQKTLLSNKPIRITRTTSSDYSFNSDYIIEDMPEVAEERQAFMKLKKAIIERLPNILYFDDFSDRVPSEIIIPKSYYLNGETLKTRGAKREWQDILKEIFDRALGDELSLISFCKNQEEDDRTNYLNDVADELDQEIISEWKKLKAAHAAFDYSESDNLKLSITAEEKEHGYVFKFKVQDTESGSRRRVFDVSNRSKGFQWFFNFIVKLKFNPKYKTHPDDAIYLLDEPGSYLHSSAQEELLKKLVEISKSNTILFCTHSQYLLDPDVINLNDVRIVSKDDGVISIVNYGEAETERNNGAYSALNDALHLKYGMPINPLGKCALVEGVTDWCFYKMFLDLPEEVTVIPGAGALQLRQLISILIASSDRFIVILDKDEEGSKAYKDYASIFEDLFIQNSFQYVSTKKKFVLEHLLDKDDVARIKQATGSKNIKKAFIKLYYSEPEKISDIKNHFTDSTVERLRSLRNQITKHLLP